MLLGLSYTISKDFGNCTVDYLENDESGDVIMHDGHIHMSNPFMDLMGGNKFTYNGMVGLYQYLIGSYHIFSVR